MRIKEKRRELFEPWVIEEVNRRSYAHQGCVLKRDSIGGYATTWVDMAWLGFNAALDAVEIELPEDWVPVDAQERGWEMMGKFRVAIESTGLGLKVKP